ncbi:MAG: polysaccharide pyruvyl transferase family protein, partial [Chloroflexota bacterium]|nr:polysaccharide pyruvyl transferase family protein [Chloroflexota bacterium]
MKEILLRARKDPFDAVSPEATLVGNLIAENAGNLIFSTAAYKIIGTADTRITADRFVIDPAAAGRINERYDAYVIPLANAFRISFEPVLIRMTQLIRRLRIPVVILGVGAQSNVLNDPARLERIEPAVRDFVTAVLDRSPSIGVRGEFTHDYLRGLGFRDVEVIGCPSMFIHGERLHIEKRRPALEPDARLAINVSPYVKAMGPVVMHHVERYPDLTYIPQDLASLERLLWGDPTPVADPAEPLPIHLAHPLFRDDKVRFFVDPWPWFDYLATMDFSFGTRIHGNIAALIAGTPSFVLAHDSRTLELVRYFEIPHRLMADVRPDVDAAELYEEADYGPLNRGHAARLATFLGYLERHGIDHIFRSNAPDPDVDTRMAATPFPTAVTIASRTAPHGLAG